MLSNLPAPSVVVDQVQTPTGSFSDPIRRDVSNPSGADEQSVFNLDNARNESSPSIAVSPNDPNKLVAVWTRTDLLEQLPFLAVSQGAYSTNGGRTWTPLSLPKPVFNPLGAIDDFTDDNRLPRSMDASVAFDRDGNIYVVSVQNDADDTDSTGSTAGAIVLQKYNFSGASPVAVELDKILYAWNEEAGIALKPTLTVDDTVPFYQDPTTGAVQANPFSGNVYVAWATVTGQIKMMASSDGGTSFSARRGISDVTPEDPDTGAGGGLNFGASLSTSPRLAVSQGRADGTGAQPGQVTAVWDDFGLAGNVSTIKSDTFVGAVSQTFSATTGVIRNATIAGPTTTMFPIRVNISDARFDSITDIDVRLSLLHPAVGDLQINLVAPDGKRLPLVLGLDGASVGVGGGGKAFGATFDQEATQVIGGQEPYIGHYKPAFQFAPPPGAQDTTFNLGDYYGLQPGQLNGLWRIEVINNGAASLGADNPPQLVEGALIVTSRANPGTDLGGQAGDDVVVTTTNALGALEGPYPVLVDAAFAAAFDRGAGPGATIASDNTLGSFRGATQGRLYVALTDFYAFAASLTGQVNTDVFLVYSDDGGATWTRSGASLANPKGLPINDDIDSRVDGFTTSLLDPESGVAIGRPQFAPELAVDQTTGTLAASFYDARYDAQEVRVARTVTTSIDGGRTYSPQLNSFANTPNAPFDVIARREVVLGPIPDNQSEGVPDGTPTLRLDPADDYSFGDRQGLVFTQGRLYVAWAGNENGGPQGLSTLDVRVAQMATSVGPRVIRSTMGQVTTTDATGTPQATGFLIEFDRPVDTATFTAGDIQVRYLPPGATQYTVIPVADPIALDPTGPSGRAATIFRVDFLAPQKGVGTYSYAVGPDIRDFGSGTSTTITPGATQTFTAGSSIDFTARTGPIAIPDGGSANAVVSISGLPSDSTIVDLEARVSINHPHPEQLTLTLISPGGGKIAVLSSGNGAGGANYTGTIFDDQAAASIVGAAAPFTGRYRPQQALSTFNGLNPNGNWTLQVADSNGAILDNGSIGEFILNVGTGANYGAISLDTVDGGKVVTTLRVTSVPAGDTIIDGIVHVDITHADARDLSLTLVSANGTRIPLPAAATATAYQNVDFSLSADAGLSAAQIGALPGNGAWKLETLDRAGGPAGGQVNDFEITFQTRQTYTAGGTVAVAPNSTAVASIPVSLPPTILVDDVDVEVSVDHNNARDLMLTLVKRDINGNEVARVLLSNRRGTGNTNGHAYQDTVFDQQAGTLITSGAVPFTGTFRPEGNLNDLNGLAGAGTWELEVQNFSLSRIGSINEFKVTLRSQSITGHADDDPATPAVTGVRMPAQGLAVATTSVSTAPGGAAITALTVNVSVQHPNPQQLDLYLIGPTGVRVLLAGAEGTVANAYTNTTFDDNAANPVAGAVGMLTGSFRPEQALAAFIGTSANGTWSLEALDRVTGVAGVITDFNLSIANRAQFGTGATVPVPDNQTRSSPIVISTLPFGSVVRDVNLTFNIAHPNVGDLIIDLVGPDGTVVNLATNIGGTNDNFINTFLDEQGLTGTPPVAAPFITAGTAPYTGTFRTQALQVDGIGLGAFNGKPANGVWQLRVRDTANNNVGTIGSWSIDIETAQSYGDPSTNVPANDVASATVLVDGLPGTDALADLNVEVSIDHPTPQDLTLILIGPDGTTVALASGQGGTTANAYTNTVFDDQAPADIFGQNGSLTGRFTPLDSLDAFRGRIPNGVWKLQVANRATGAPVAASIREFSLSFRTETSYGSLPDQAAIPDPGVVVVPLTVSGIAPLDSLTDLDVTVSIQHPRTRDLVLTLIAPDGTRVLLSSGNPTSSPGAPGPNYTGTIFDDQASVAINAPGAAQPPFTGRFRPQQVLSALNGMVGSVINGQWKLEVRDLAGGSVGAVTDFRIGLRTAPTFAPSDTLPIALDDNSSQTLTIPVSGLPAGDFTADVDLVLTIEHPNVSDLRIFLEAPDGTRVALVSNALAPAVPTLTGANFTGTVFDNEAAASINAGASPFTGRFRPQQALSALYGRVANGDWKLIVEDTVGGGQTGIIRDARLVLLTQTASSVLPLPIRDLSTTVASLLVDTLPADEVVTDVNVRVSLTHPLARGVDLYLVSPDGTRVALSLDNGGPNGANYTGTIFDDQAAQSIVGAAAPFTGRFRPQQALSRLNGRPGNGVWRLEVVDDSTANPINEGVLTEFSLEITTGARVVSPTIAGNAMDQDADALTIDTPGVDAAEAGNDTYSTPRSLSGQPFAPAFDPQTLPLIVPGPHVINSYVEGVADTNDNLVTDRTVSSIVVVFDRDMRPGTFTATDVLRLEGPGGVISGPFTVSSIDARNFRIGFPAQRLSGTYSVVLGADIEAVGDSRVDDPADPATIGGDKVDTNLNAGLDSLRGVATAGTTRISRSNPTDVPIPAAPSPVVPRIVESVIDLTGNVDYQFALADLDVRINIAFPSAPDLRVELVAEGAGESGADISILLVDRIGQTGTRADFFDTVFNDQAVTPIENGGPPFQGEYTPQVGLNGLTLSDLNQTLAGRRYRLVVTNFSDAPTSTGLINEWELIFRKPVPFTGLGESVADRSTASFRIFTMDPTNPLSSTTWTAVGPAGVSSPDNAAAATNPEVSGRVNDLAIDPSDPSGNTVYAASASGGLWKTTNFLTTNPAGPTWIPLLDNGPLQGMTVGGITLVAVNNDPNQTRVFVATGDGRAVGDPERPAGTTSRGVGFLRSLDGGATWELLDSTNNGLAFSARNHFFAAGTGTTSMKLVSDPKLTPGGQVILYAAMADLDAVGNLNYAGTRGGLWRSLDSGTTWTRLRAGQASDVVLDPLSGTGAPDGSLQSLYVAFQNDGIYFSNNRGDDLLTLPGATGKPLIQNIDFPQPQPAQAVTPATNGATRFSPNTYGAVIPGFGTLHIGRIQLAKPTPTGDTLQDAQYQGWMYASVQLAIGDLVEDFPPILPHSSLYALFMTKDFGQNWTRILAPDIRIATNPNIPDTYIDIPSNFFDPTDVQLFTPSVDPTGSSTPGGGTPYFFGNFSSALAVDPNDPNVIYFGGSTVYGGTGLVRIDTTGIADPHAFYLSNDDTDQDPTEGVFRTHAGYADSTANPLKAPLDFDESGNPLTLFGPVLFYPYFGPTELGDPAFDVKAFDPIRTPFINLIRNPNSPFQAGATVLVHGVTSFNNSGTKSRWTPFDVAAQPNPFKTTTGNNGSDTSSRSTRGFQRILTVRDPLTGATRLYIANDNGVYTAVDQGDGSLVGSIGNVVDPTTTTGDVKIVNGTRNGNLQIAQFLAGASQPTALSAQLATLQGMFMGNGTETGQPISNANVIEPGQAGYGNLQWVARDNRESGYGVAAQQNFDVVVGPGGVLKPSVVGGDVYQFENPAGLVAADFPGDTFHPATDFFQVNNVSRTFGLVQTQNGGNVPDAQWPFRGGFNFAVNPLNGSQIVIGSAAGRVFRTETAGTVWTEIARPGVDVDASVANTFAYGAPEKQDPTNLGDFIYVGKESGAIYVTRTGAAPWRSISNGLDGSPVRSIVTNPTRGSYDAYAVTEGGVFYIADIRATTARWTNITGNLFDLTHNPFGQAGVIEDRIQLLTSVVADYRYAIPDSFASPSGPSHPILYVSGDSGVYRSIDNGAHWLPFPASDPKSLDNTPVPPGDGGGLPSVQVNDLDLVLGAIDPTNGRPQGLVNTAEGAATSPNVLLASTYGRGAFAIRLAPVTLADSLHLSPALPSPDGSDSGSSSTDAITSVTRPVISGYSQQTAFGNVVRVRLFQLKRSDPADPTSPLVIDRPIGGWDPANPATDITANRTDETGLFNVRINAGMFAADGSNDGEILVGVQTFDQANTPGNVAIFRYTLDTTAPAAANTPDLQAASDTGASSTDNITSDRTPTFDIAGVEPGATIILFRNGVEVRRIVSLLGGSVTLTDDVLPGGLPDGAYVYTSRQIDVAGNASPLSGGLTVIVPDTPTTDPNAPDLQAASDTGQSSTDNVTNDSTPTFDIGVGTGTPGQLVTLFRRAVGSPTAVPVGTVASPGSITDSTVPDGVYQYFTVRGATTSASLIVTIDTTIARLAAPDLQAASDTGVPTDNITSVTSPAFDVSVVEAGATVRLFRQRVGVDPLPVLARTITSPVGGIVAVQDLGPLEDGDYLFMAQQVDLAGNLSPDSPSLLVTVSGGQANPPSAPDLTDASDLGRSNSDDITQATVGRLPTFDVAVANATATVQLLRKVAGAPDDTYIVVQSRTGPGLVTDPGPVFVDGDYEYAARQITQVGSATIFSAISPSLLVTIDNTSPISPAAPDLTDESDTGRSNSDNATADNTPTFRVSGVEPNARVYLLRNGANVGSFVLAGPSGVVLLTDPSAPDGTHIYRVVQEDIAGNISALGNTLQVIVDTIAPPAPSLAPDLQAASDTGFSTTDNITSNTNPTFDVSFSLPPQQEIYAKLLRRPAGSSGPYTWVGETNYAGPVSITTPILLSVRDLGVDLSTNPARPVTPVAVPQGTYQYVFQLVDRAGNPIDQAAGPVSPSLTVDILTATPSAPTGLVLDPGSDTGDLGDRVTGRSTNLVFNASGITPGRLGVYVELYRDGVRVDRKLVNSPATTVALTDAGPADDGQRVYTVRQIDPAGNQGPLAPTPALTITIDTQAPAAPRTPDLLVTSDTGRSNTDNTTADSAPAFDIQAPVGGAEPGSTFVLYRDGVEVHRAVSVDGVIATITDNTAAGGLPDGDYTYTARRIDVAGNAGPLGPGLLVRIDRTPPVAPSPPDLQAASDTGASDTDNLTSDNTPTFDALGVEVDALVELLRDGIPVASRIGAGPLTDPIAPDGTHSYSIRQTDLAGNAGPQDSPALVVVVDPTLPVAPDVPDLQAASDTGASDFDNLTNASFLTFNLTGVPAGLSVQLLRGGTVVAVRSGPGAITDPSSSSLADGSYSYAARVLSALGNPGSPSVPLVVTIDRTAPAPTTVAPDLQAASDTGASAIDNVTARNNPTFDLAGIPAGLSVQLLRDGLPVANRIGSGAITDPGPAAEGDHQYSVRTIDDAGNPSASGPVLVIKVDGTPPAPVLSLLPADDLGVKGDNRTSVRRPRLTGATDPGAVVDLVDSSGRPLGSTTAAADGSFTVRPDANLPVGTTTLLARVRDLAGNAGSSNGLPLTVTPLAPADYDGDGKSDYGVYGPNPALPGSNRFLIDRSVGSDIVQPFGGPKDFPLVGDYDGDGIVDIGVYGYSADEGFARFGIRLSGGGTINQPFGGPFDVPMVGDYDGDGKADLAVYGYSSDNGFTRFAVLLSGGPSSQHPAGNITQLFGGPDDLPMAGDYDGDGKTDLGVYGYSADNGYSRFAILLSGGPSSQYPAGNITRGFGGRVDSPMVGDYDGDGKADLAVFGYSADNGFSRFAILLSAGASSQYPAGNITRGFGGPDDLPVGADYDGDGKTDLAVYGYSADEGLARFAVIPTASGLAYSKPFGAQGDVGLPPSSRIFDGVGSGQPTTFSAFSTRSVSANTSAISLAVSAAPTSPSTSTASGTASLNLGTQAASFAGTRRRAAAANNQGTGARSSAADAAHAKATRPAAQADADTLASAIERIGRIRANRLLNRPRNG